jgi:hypothetical protein
MTRHETLFTRARNSDPIRRDAFEDVAHTRAGEATLNAIIKDTGSADTPPRATQKPISIGLNTKRHIRRIAFVALLTAVGSVLYNGLNPGDKRNGDSAWSAELVRFAESSPRLLLDTDGWTVTRAHELDEDEGEMSFQRGGDRVELHWRPLDTHRSYVEDRRVGSERSWDITVDGHEGELFRYEGTNNYTALWSDDVHSLELRADNLDEGVEEFRVLAAGLHQVDVDTWLFAMPDSVVKPDTRAATVDQILEDIPIPDGLDVEGLKDGQTVSDEYQLGAQVTGAVACRWIEQWIVAGQNGDADRRSEAVAALATSHKWDVLHDMFDQGAWSEALWSYADAITANPTGGPEVVAGYESGLGCDMK